MINKVKIIIIIKNIKQKVIDFKITNKERNYGLG
jgi:hypothetical protein